ncbi:Coiled-coil domain-containing protein R3HCC1L [Amphibalanus amphitrite]|uniref:Coiled-coil domain-containing protein R3HCC1L n=1 Tax=Amphibalanus amphitrite TaxID=1232801 RepID=A0A6A4X222_AMPAM|nr:basic proline-rich protein-like [Amphibalanus amphitrite]KAF0313367.1 Coiled-coil domain-containing protein R3HCC1L [Amphibalanus amphitrite]
MSTSRVFYASGAGPGAETVGRPRQSPFGGGARRSAEPGPGRERRPPQQLYVPPRHRQGGASSGFNRASSPGLSTCSEIVTSWRARATPPRASSPGPLSPSAARPPTGPRRRLSQQASDGGGGGGGAWRQSGDSLSQSRPSSRQGSVEPAGSPRKRSGRRRRRSGRRSRSKSGDRPASAAEPMSPSHAPWRRDHRDSWDGGQPPRPSSPRGPARPRFQQVYVPPARRDGESPAPLAAAPRPELDRPSPAHQPPGGGRGRGVHTPQRVASPAPTAAYSRPSPAPPPPGGPPRRPPAGDEPGSTASLGRRGSSRRRRRGRDSGAAAPSPAPDRRSMSPTDLIASLQLEGAGSAPLAPGSPAGRAPALSEPQSPTDVMAHLGVRPSPLLARTDSLGQLVNTTDDEKVTLGGGRGRGRGRPRERQPTSPGPAAAALPQSDEVKAALRRPHSARSKERWADSADTERGPTPTPSKVIVGPSPAGMSNKSGCDVSPHHVQGAIVRQSPERSGGGPGHISAGSAGSQPAVSQSPPATSSPLEGVASAATVTQQSAVSRAPPLATSAEERTPPSHPDSSQVMNSPPEPPSAAPADPAPVAPAPDSAPAAVDAEGPEPAGCRAAERPASAEPPAPERTRRRSSASFSGLFNLSLDEPFDWADEVDEWERRFNDDGEAADSEHKAPASPVKRRPSAGGGGGRSRRPDRPEVGDEPPSDPSLPAHVIELYNFPSGFSKQDFNVVFADFVRSGFDVRPVDDRHALGVFSSAACAAEALRLCHPMLLSRPLSKATARSRQKAAVPANAQLPHRARPETSALHAGRMVATALGVHAPSDGRARQRRDQERRKLRDAKDKKRLANKQRDDAWEGRF